MKIPGEIKNKVKEFLKYVRNSENINSNDAIEKFKEIFEGQYVSEYEHINEAYYEVKTERYYIKDGCGLTLEAHSGDFDRYGSKVSHVGTDIYLKSKLSKNKEYRAGILLFYEDEKDINDELENIDDILNEKIKKDNIVEMTKKTYNDGLFNIIPDEIKNNDEIAFLRYLQLKNIAEYTYKNDFEYERISPYRRS